MESIATLSTIDRAEELLLEGESRPALEMVRTLYGQTLTSTDRGRALALEAACLAELNRDEEAENLIETVMKEEGDDLAFVLAAGVEFSNLGDFLHAEIFLRNLCELEPGNHLAWFNLAIALGRESRYHEAAESYQKCIAIDPAFTEAYVQRAYCLEMLEDIEGAVAMYSAYLERVPGDGDAWKALGIAESERKHFDAAYDAFRRALEHTDDPEDIYFNWAITAVRQEDAHELAQCVEKLQDLDPDGWRTLLTRADLEEGEGNVWHAWELVCEAFENVEADEAEEDEARGYVAAAMLRFAQRKDMREHASEYVLRIFEHGILTEEVLEALQAYENPLSNAAGSFQVMLKCERDGAVRYIVYGVSAETADDAGRFAREFEERCSTDTWTLYAVHQISPPDEGRLGVYWRSNEYNRPPGS